MMAAGFEHPAIFIYTILMKTRTRNAYLNMLPRSNIYPPVQECLTRVCPYPPPDAAPSPLGPRGGLRTERPGHGHTLYTRYTCLAHGGRGTVQHRWGRGAEASG